MEETEEENAMRAPGANEGTEQNKKATRRRKKAGKRGRSVRGQATWYRRKEEGG